MGDSIKGRLNINARDLILTTTTKTLFYLPFWAELELWISQLLPVLISEQSEE